MLKSLELKNVALIDKATIDFSSGLNVLSGETGAGKSVIIDSLNFALGAKADKTMIRRGENECSVTAVFDVSSSPAVKELLNENGIDFDDELVISRKLNLDGKGTIRLNGELVTSSTVKPITALLLDVHGQSEHFSLLKESEQLKILDRFSDVKVSKIKEDIKEIILSLKEADEVLSSLGGSARDREIRADVLKFQIAEITNADLKDGEEDELTKKSLAIKNAEKIGEALSAVSCAIKEDGCAEDMIGEAARSLGKISDYGEEYSALKERLEAILEELNDIAYAADDYLSSCDFNPLEADKIMARLDLIKTLKRKYGDSVSEIFEFLHTAEAEYDKLVNFDGEFALATKRKEELIKKLNGKYEELSALRKAGAENFSSKVKRQLKELGMKNAEFTVDFVGFSLAEQPPYKIGGDEIEFMFSANLGEPVKPLSKIISGGEMSRFMLSLKVIISAFQEISTYVFDEIDAGLSGETSKIVAQKFAKIAKNTQVIAISHLPQICAMADASLKIEKHERDGKTYTSVALLSAEEKRNEIIRIIGSSDTEAARTLADEILSSAREFKNKL